ncbi:MAG: CRTAC1 family protein, partial [Planctomycetaceae bacterium]
QLYHNQRNGTFEEVTVRAGVSRPATFQCKGATWLDYDNDGNQDLFVNYHSPHVPAELFHNRGDGTFTEVSSSQQIAGPRQGFSCWTWDYNNDGWMDIFATSYDRSVGDVVVSMLGKGHKLESNRLYCNMQGKGFKDVTQDAGLNMVFSAMGTNYGDFDNDGFLDMYLGTGEPELAALIPNRMFRNVRGKRFSDITASSGTGSLQKGHGVSCGDWDRDGNVDIFIEMGGVIKGDMYHNMLFQNPGHNNSWLTIKLVGTKTNRAAIGARIKVLTQGPEPQTIHRHVSTGSSFGANPLQQTIGLGKAEKIAELEITWPTSGTTQTFHDIDVNQAISITEFENTYVELDWPPISAAAGLASGQSK